MKAVIIRGYGGPEQLAYTDVDRPTPKDDEVLVKVAASSVNPVDWQIREGLVKMFIRMKLPGIPGCDLAGKVAEVGKAVTRFKVGDAVFAMMPNDWGAQAEFVPLAEHLVVMKPAGLTDEEAASIPTTALTSLKALRQCAEVKPGQSVLVNGASGGVGLFGVQIAKALGATVTAVCGAASFDMVKGLGADHLIDYKTTDFTKGTEKYDVVFDCIGNQPYGACKGVMRGKWVHVTTMPNGGVFFRQMWNSFTTGKVVALVTTGEGDKLEYIKTLVEAGKVKTIIDKVFPIAEIAAAQEYSRAGRAKGKIVLKFPD